VHDQDDEGSNVRGEGFQVDQIKATRQFLKTFYADGAADRVEVNLLILTPTLSPTNLSVYLLINASQILAARIFRHNC